MCFIMKHDHPGMNRTLKADWFLLSAYGMVLGWIWMALVCFQVMNLSDNSNRPIVHNWLSLDLYFMCTCNTAHSIQLSIRLFWIPSIQSVHLSLQVSPSVHLSVYPSIHLQHHVKVIVYIYILYTSIYVYIYMYNIYIHCQSGGGSALQQNRRRLG